MSCMIVICGAVSTANPMNKYPATALLLMNMEPVKPNKAIPEIASALYRSICLAIVFLEKVLLVLK